MHRHNARKASLLGKPRGAGAPAPLPAGGQGQNRNLAARLLQLDDQSTRQQEVLYDVEFALQASRARACWPPRGGYVRRWPKRDGRADSGCIANSRVPELPRRASALGDCQFPSPTSHLQDMERKLSRAQGHRTEDETRALRERIEQLTGTLEGVAAEHSMLVNQVKAAEVALNDSRRANEAFVKDRRALGGGRVAGRGTCF